MKKRFCLKRRDRASGALSVVESGFDKIPMSRRAQAFRMNSGGWEEQMKNIERHLNAR